MNKLDFLSANLPEDILRLINYGDFEHALNIIELRLKNNIPEALRERLEFEKIRVQRLKRNYTYTFDDALSMAQKKINNFNSDELNKLKDEGYADWIFINGKVMFQTRFLENIIKTYPNIENRLIHSESEDLGEKQNRLLDDTISEIIEKGHKNYHIHIKTGLRLMNEALRSDEIVKVHLPIPTLCQQIKNIEIIKTLPRSKFISPEDYPQRTVYFEEKICDENEFSVEYSYENHVHYNNLDYSNLHYNNASENQPSFNTEELEPHIVFTPYLKKLAGEITGDEKNPLKKTRKIYDFITTKIKYSYVREYLTIENIPEYAAVNLKGDCGVQALLFITLCRIAGIPAKWQSGLYVTPYNIGCHDWAQFYIAPYGWLFADLSFGGSAYRKNNIKRWNYYFGNIDPFRMPANSEFQHDFMPRKKFLRSDPYDNQIGEAEYKNENIFSDKFESIMKVIEIHEI